MTSSEAGRAPSAPQAAVPPTPRRGFLKTVTAFLGGLVGAVFAYPAIRYLSFPVVRRVVDSASEPVPVADEAAVRAGGPPVRVEIVVASRRDAWSRTERVRLGAAWLVRSADGRVRAFSTRCPHLGCAIDFDAAAGKFRCPCHESAFGLDGAREAGPAKRGLDPLETTVKEGRVYVRWRKFKLDVAAREEA